MLHNAAQCCNDCMSKIFVCLDKTKKKHLRKEKEKDKTGKLPSLSEPQVFLAANSRTPLAYAVRSKRLSGVYAVSPRGGRDETIQKDVDA